MIRRWDHKDGKWVEYGQVSNGDFYMISDLHISPSRSSYTSWPSIESALAALGYLEVQIVPNKGLLGNPSTTSHNWNYLSIQMECNLCGISYADFVHLSNFGAGCDCPGFVRTSQGPTPVDAKGCSHVPKLYTGLIEQFTYCEKCDKRL